MVRDEPNVTVRSPDSLATPVREHRTFVIYFIAKTTHCKETVNSLKNIFDQKRFKIWIICPWWFTFNCIAPVIRLFRHFETLKSHFWSHEVALYYSSSGRVMTRSCEAGLVYTGVRDPWTGSGCTLTAWLQFQLDSFDSKEPSIPFPNSTFPFSNNPKNHFNSDPPITYFK